MADYWYNLVPKQRQQQLTQQMRDPSKRQGASYWYDLLTPQEKSQYQNQYKQQGSSTRTQYPYAAGQDKEERQLKSSYNLSQPLVPVAKPKTTAKPKTITTAPARPVGSVATPRGTSGASLPKINTGINQSDLARARDLIELEYGAKESALKRGMGQSRTDYDRLLADLNEALQQGETAQTKYGQIGDVKLQEIYNSLQGELGRLQQGTGDIYAQGQQQLQQAYAPQQMTQAAEGFQQGLTQRAERLGLGAALPDVMTELQGQLAGSQQRMSESGAGALGNLITQGTGEQGIAQQGIAASRKELAQERADLAVEVSNALSQLKLEGVKGKRDLQRNLQDTLTELGGQLAQLQGERGTALREAVRQVEEARTDRERQTRLDALSEQIQIAQLDISRGELGIRQQELNLQKQVALNPLTGKPYEAEQAQANLQQTQLENKALLQKLAGTDIDPQWVVELAAQNFMSVEEILRMLQEAGVT